MSHVIDVSDETFADAVLDESRRRPVVVDFWASWCQPCRMLSPMLERLANEAGGTFLLAMVDVDANPQLAMAFRIQSVPTVIAFRDGRLFDQFSGVLPEQSLRMFLQRLEPSEADQLASQAETAQAEGRVEDAGALYQRALAIDPGHRAASLGLGRILASRGDLDGAKIIHEPFRPDPEADRLLAAVEVARWGGPEPNGEGPLAQAERAAAEGRFRDALETFLREVRAGGEGRDEA